MEHYHLAVAAAQQAAEPLLSAYMLGSMAALASEQGAADQALAFCDTARRELARGAPPTAHTWLTTIEATALASTGDGDSAMSALRQAAAAAERGRNPPGPGSTGSGRRRFSRPVAHASSGSASRRRPRRSCRMR